jgi:excisionase family DNA binding protein
MLTNTLQAEPLVRSARPFLSRGQVAGLFGVSLSTVTRWARTGLIPSIRTPGGHYRFRTEDFRNTSPGTFPGLPAEGTPANDA